MLIQRGLVKPQGSRFFDLSCHSQVLSLINWAIACTLSVFECYSRDDTAPHQHIRMLKA
jgi:hypothetical protein